MDRMPGPPAGVTSPPVFVDGFGARYQTFDSETGDSSDAVEVLAFNKHLVDAPDFAASVGIRVARLAGVRHSLLAQVRRLDRPSEDAVHLVSDHVAGWRLAHVLDVAEHENLTFDINVILNLMRQLVPTVALFARHQRELAVGTISPEHLILTPRGRLVLAEYVLGSAIEKLSLSREVLWRRLRVVSTPGPAKISTRSDAQGIGIVVLSLLHGRRLGDAEFPDALGNLFQRARESSDDGQRPLSTKLAAWLGSALQLQGHVGFQTPAEAQAAFEELLMSERHYVTTPEAVESFIANFTAITGPPDIPRVSKERAPVVSKVERPEVSKVERPAVSKAERPAAPPVDRPILRPIEPRAESEVERPAVNKVERPVPAPQEPAANAAARPPLSVEELVSSVVAELPALTPPPPPPSPVVERKRVATPEPVRAPERVAGHGDDARRQFPFDLGDWTGKALAALALVAVIEFFVLVWLWGRPSESLAGDGELVVQSRPTGATVTLDDNDLGTTPVTIQLSPGTYTLKVQVGKGEPRVIPVQIRAGVQTVQYLELQAGR